MQIDTHPQPVVAVVKDLMFGSKISATARAAGQAIVMLRDPAAALAQAGRLLLVDLSLPGAIEAAAGWKLAHQQPVVGFVSHVDTETIAKARQAGLDQVLARSAFSAQLESLINSR